MVALQTAPYILSLKRRSFMAQKDNFLSHVLLQISAPDFPDGSSPVIELDQGVYVSRCLVDVYLRG